ncbi:MAG: hypothetical protein NVS3B17_04940 [Vulcanimicrobiaceae bacterium]
MQSRIEIGEPLMQSQLTQFVLMAVFFGVLVAVPVLWYLVGIKTYGTGDYHQP